MSFFHEIHNLGTDADLTLRIVRKDEKLTIEVKPGPRTSLTPKTISGTPDELTDGFLKAILSKPETKDGLNVQELPTQASDKMESPAPKEQSATSPKDKGGKSKHGKKKELPTKKAGKAPKAQGPQEVSMFDQPPVTEERTNEEGGAAQPAASETDQEDDNETEE